MNAFSSSETGNSNTNSQMNMNMKSTNLFEKYLPHNTFQSKQETNFIKPFNYKPNKRRLNLIKPSTGNNNKKSSIQRRGMNLIGSNKNGKKFKKFKPPK